MPKHVDAADLEADGGESDSRRTEKTPMDFHGLVTQAMNQWPPRETYLITTTDNRLFMLHFIGLKSFLMTETVFGISNSSSL